MGIDYTKRPGPPAPAPSTADAAPPTADAAPPTADAAPPTADAAPPTADAAPPSKVTLTKSAPTVSLTKQGSATGLLRVNLNWDARPAEQGRGLFKRAAPAIDLDLGCLYEFTDGSKGVIQALGNAFAVRAQGASDNVIWLDGDDRSGTNTTGENLFVNLAYAATIRRIIVFALIYEGVANWAAAQGVVTLHPAVGPQVEVRLDDTRDGARICAVAMLESTGGDLSVRREVNYLNGGQRLLDETYGWGMNWAAGRK